MNDADAPGKALADAPLSGGTPIKMRVRETIVLRVVGKALIPFILLFGLYVQFHGDYGPGGGFQAGVIFAAGLILHALIYGLDSLREKVPPLVVEIGVAAGALLYGGVGVVSMLMSAPSARLPCKSAIVSGRIKGVSPKSISVSPPRGSSTGAAMVTA